MDFKWTHMRAGYEYLHIVIVWEQQRGTKEVETVSLRSKYIFGQKQNKSPFTDFTPLNVNLRLATIEYL